MMCALPYPRVGTCGNTTRSTLRGFGTANPGRAKEKWAARKIWGEWARFPLTEGNGSINLTLRFLQELAIGNGISSIDRVGSATPASSLCPARSYEVGADVPATPRIRHTGNCVPQPKPSKAMLSAWGPSARSAIARSHVRNAARAPGALHFRASGPLDPWPVLSAEKRCPAFPHFAFRPAFRELRAETEITRNEVVQDGCVCTKLAKA